MRCTTLRLPDGAVAIVCGRGPRRQRCYTCGQTARHRCDGPGPAGASRKTCDRWLCDAHRHHVHPDKDFCPEHSREPIRVQGELGLA